MHFRDMAPPEVAGDAARIILTGREEVLLEGHGGLFSYETKAVRVRTKSGLITVSGDQLVIDHFGPWDMLIRGRVDGVQIGTASTSVSGRQMTPGGAFEIMDILGKDESLRRIELGIAKLSA